MKTKLLFLFILLFCLLINLPSQNTSFYASVGSVSLDTTKTLFVADGFGLLSTKRHSPIKATLWSTFLPGIGQIYNRQAWKVPIIYVAFAGVTYFAIINGKNKEKFKDEYYNRISGRKELLLTDYSTYTDEGIYNLYNAYKSNFQLSIITGIVFYALQILDAYVYGHLFSFDLTDDLTMNLLPRCIPMMTRETSLGFSFNLKF